MSYLSGKCDLLDHISGLGGWYDREGNPVKFGEGHGAYYSDIYQDFVEFKKRTNGVLHQHKRIKEVNEFNQEFVCKHAYSFDIITHIETIKDKRLKTGSKEKVYYTYKYFGKEYTAKELKKKGGVFITIDIHFETLLDLIPYLPYIVSACSFMDGKEHVIISGRSFVEEEADESLEYGHERDTYFYREKLSKLYQECVLKYFNPAGKEHVEKITFNEEGLGRVSHPIDENFKVEWRWKDGDLHTHWTSPEIISAKEGLIRMHKYDLELLGCDMLVYYVEYVKPELWLG